MQINVNYIKICTDMATYFIVSIRKELANFKNKLLHQLNIGTRPLMRLFLLIYNGSYKDYLETWDGY